MQNFEYGRLGSSLDGYGRISYDFENFFGNFSLMLFVVRNGE